MDFKTSNYNNSLLEALVAANSGDNPSENIVIVDCDCSDSLESFQTRIFDYIRIKGVATTKADDYDNISVILKPTIKDFNLIVRKGVYVENVIIDYSSSAASNKFIVVTPYVAQTEEVVTPIDINIKNSYIRNTYTLLGYLAPTDVPTSGEALPFRKITVEGCSFETNGGKMIDLPCACNRVVIKNNRYDFCGEDDETGIQSFINLGAADNKCRNVEIAFNKMYSTKQGVIPNSSTTIESHFCKVYGDKVSVHDNIYNGFTVSDSTMETCSCEPIYIIGSSDTRIYRNILENFSVGKGAITLEGVFDNVNVSKNKIDPGSDTNQGSGKAHSLINIQSLGGVGVFDGATKVKIDSNDLTYHRAAGFESQECLSAINFSGTNNELASNKLDILISRNDYSGINNFVRFVQKTKKPIINIFKNNVQGFGFLGLIKKPKINLFVVASSNVEIAPTVNIIGNKGNVGAVCANTHSTASATDEDRMRYYIANNDLFVRRIALSSEYSTVNEKIDIFVINNKFSIPNSKNINSVDMVNNDPINSSAVNYVFCNNEVYYEVDSHPKRLFFGTRNITDFMRCGSMTVIGNGFYDLSENSTYTGNFVKNLGENQEQDSEQNKDYFIEGYFENFVESDNYPVATTSLETE